MHFRLSALKRLSLFGSYMRHIFIWRHCAHHSGIDGGQGDQFSHESGEQNKEIKSHYPENFNFLN